MKANITATELRNTFEACIEGFCLDVKCPFYIGCDRCDRNKLHKEVLKLVDRLLEKEESRKTLTRLILTNFKRRDLRPCLFRIKSIRRERRK